MTREQEIFDIVVAICYLSSSWYGEDYPDDHYILPIASGEGATAPT